MSKNVNRAETETKSVYDSKADVLASQSAQHSEEDQSKLVQQVAVAEAITDRYVKALQELAKQFLRSRNGS
jgi:flagellar motility protein MotE (MotC chaperone)